MANNKKDSKLVATCKIVLALLLLGWYLLFFGPGPWNQKRNMKLARDHINTKLSKVVYREKRFSNVILSDFSASNGSVHVWGYVNNINDLVDLRRIVMESDSPVNVEFTVRIKQKKATNQPDKK